MYLGPGPNQIVDRKVVESGGLEPFYFFHILGISTSHLTNSYLSHVWLNHQPGEFGKQLGRDQSFKVGELTSKKYESYHPHMYTCMYSYAMYENVFSININI